MRELQFTQAILQKVLARSLDAKQIKNIVIAVGEISELDQALIEKYWHEIRKGTAAEQAQLHVRLIKAEVQCMACFSKYFPVDGKIHCPYCGSYGAKVLSGEEFYLDSVELEDN